jgi:hypothetical protein
VITGPTSTHRVTKITGMQREFDAGTTEQHPDELVAWTTVEGGWRGEVQRPAQTGETSG